MKKQEKNKENKIPGLIIGLFTMIMLSIGATYAYFNVSVTRNFGTSTISSTAQGAGSVALTKTNNNLSMNLTTADLSISEGNASYYGTTDGTPANSANYVNIGNVTATGSGYYDCEYTLNVTASGSTNMYTAFQGMGTKSSGQIVMQIGGFYTFGYYDFNTANLFPITATGHVYVSSDNPESIFASLYFASRIDNIQNGLQGTSITITPTVTSFTCKATTPSMIYTNYAVQDVTSNTGLDYYVKTSSIEGTVFSETCAVFDGTEICLKPPSAFTYISYYKSKFESVGATCNSTYVNDGYLLCTKGSLSCGIASDQTFCGNQSYGCTVTTPSTPNCFEN